MAYRIKSVKYIDTPRKILLQNENGPCPLLAAANALLLRGVITLPSPCIRNGVVSIDELIHVLADRAIKRSNDEASAAASAGEWIPVDDDKKKKVKSGGNADAKKKKEEEEETALLQMNSHEYHLDELLSLLPNLQYGMDVNPKFTCGPTGIEYTLGLTAFDLLGVELVHGWLLDKEDTHDGHIAQVVGNKTYNELIELVICGKEAGERVEGLGTEIEMMKGRIEEERVRREQQYGTLDDSQDCDDDVKVGKCDETSSENENKNDNENTVVTKESGEEWVNVEKQSATDESSLKVEDNQNASQHSNDASPSTPPSHDAAAGKTTGDTTPPQKQNEAKSSVNKETNAKKAPLSDDEITQLTTQLSTLKTQYNQKSLTATNGTVINTFLTTTSHQLTYHGLHELHKFLPEQSLCVFFRNNHFATLTKHNGILYLLVTDLGYANVPEVVWEKLDAIDGDTEYADEYFEKPKPRKTLAPATGLNLNPEDVLAQRGRAEADYQLALQLSKEGGGKSGGNGGSPKKSREQLDEEEGRLMAAATEASLMEYNKNNNSGGGGGHLTSPGMTQPQPSLTTTTTKDSSGATISHDVDSDHKMALALQAQMEADDESEALARRLQNEENNRQRQQQQQQQTGGGRQQQQQQQRMASPTNRTKNTSSSDGGGKSSSCVIS